MALEHNGKYLFFFWFTKSFLCKKKKKTQLFCEQMAVTEKALTTGGDGLCGRHMWPTSSLGCSYVSKP